MAITSKHARSKYIRWFDEIGIGDVALVGGKNASLGEMYRTLTPRGINIPAGFAVTAEGYRHFLAETGLDVEVREILRGLDTRDLENLRSRGSSVRHAFLAVSLPADLQDEIVDAYDALNRAVGLTSPGSFTGPLDVAVRSSATAEDLPDASFAGQQETYLNVQGSQPCSRPASAASPRSTPTGRSPTAWTRGSTTSRSACRSASSAWSGPTWPPPGSCSRSTPRPASATPC